MTEIEKRADLPEACPLEEARRRLLQEKREDAARRLESLQSHIDAALEAEGG